MSPGTSQTTGQIVAKFRAARGSGSGECPHHHMITRLHHGPLLTNQMPQPTLHPIAGNSAANRLGNHETDLDRRIQLFIVNTTLRTAETVHHQCGGRGSAPAPYGAGEFRRCGEPAVSGKHDGDDRRGDQSDAQAFAPLAATRGKDRPAGASTHAKAESVHLVTAPVVRLIRTLAHQFALSLAGFTTGQRYALARSRVKPTTSMQDPFPSSLCGERLATRREPLLSSKNRVPHPHPTQ